jgi:hypothetical protein
LISLKKQPLQEYERAIEKKVKKAEEEKKANQEIIAKMKSEGTNKSSSYL